MNLDDPKQRRAFRKKLAELGLPEVRYRLAAKKLSRQKAAVVEQWIADVESGATLEDDLIDAADALISLKARFVQGGNMMGLFLQTDDQARFERLFLEAKTLVDERLGESNDYSRMLINLYQEGVGGMSGGTSLACVTGMAEIIHGAIKYMQRRPSVPLSVMKTEPGKDPYIDNSRITAIRDAQSEKWDLSRLLQMCIEVNLAYENECYFSVGMLVRGIMDHVPPIFGKAKFAEVASNHGGSSIKASMQHLENSMRKIADSYLHQQVRQKESLSSPVQVDVRRDLDVLLAEIIRLA